MKRKIQILPSLLAADVGHLYDEIRRTVEAGADGLHLDIMDGHFVPNLSYGPEICRMARKAADYPMHVHLMMSNPHQFVETFASAGADTILIHVEADCDTAAVIDDIKKRDIRAGIVLNPDTSADDVLTLIPDIDEVLCMTVFPGYGGQEFISDVLPTIGAIRAHADELSQNLDISVDGGVDVNTAAKCAAHGANVFAAGSSLFKADDMKAAIVEMRRAVQDRLS